MSSRAEVSGFVWLLGFACIVGGAGILGGAGLAFILAGAILLFTWLVQ